MVSIKFRLGSDTEDKMRVGCSAIEELEDRASSEVSARALMEVAEVLKEITCGYGYGGYVDPDKIQLHADHLRDESRNIQEMPQQEESSFDSGIYRNQCQIVQDDVIPQLMGIRISERVGFVYDTPADHRGQVVKDPYGEKTTLGEYHKIGGFIEKAIGCSIDALWEIACGEPPNKGHIENDASCIDQFVEKLLEIEHAPHGSGAEDDTRWA